mmetsp:Transcript_27352/g.50288  ORF Transcript_27352/g.50288 Transcript_27352/m.50288 type:complete len:238 (+) Transcript_27352:223-936(+)
MKSVATAASSRRPMGSVNAYVVAAANAQHSTGPVTTSYQERCEVPMRSKYTPKTIDNPTVTHSTTCLAIFTTSCKASSAATAATPSLPKTSIVRLAASKYECPFRPTKTKAYALKKFRNHSRAQHTARIMIWTHGFSLDLPLSKASCKAFNSAIQKEPKTTLPSPPVVAKQNAPQGDFAGVLTPTAEPSEQQIVTWITLESTSIAQTYENTMSTGTKPGTAIISSCTSGGGLGPVNK